MFVMSATPDDAAVDGVGARVSRNADGDWTYTTHRDWQSLTEIADELFIDVDELVEVHIICASESKMSCARPTAVLKLVSCVVVCSRMWRVIA